VRGLSVARTARLLSLPAGAVALSAEGLVRRRVLGQDADDVRRSLRARSTARTRRVLGELKGGALKAGQLLSTVEALFPQDPEATWREALVSLQEDAGALPFVEVEPVLVAELGPRWRDRFASFDERAVAAASLGQVHRATLVDGTAVAVKVQYPGVREALVSDLRTISAATRLASVVARGLTLPPLLRELRLRLVEELDYRHEAAAQERFRLGYGDDVVVPRVVEATSRVLVSTWLDGTPLAAVAGRGSVAEREAAAAAYQLFLVSGPERVGLLHTDPHPGNFRVMADGRLGVLDFGSTLALDGMPATFGRLLRALLGESPAEVEAALRDAGFLRGPVDVTKLVGWMAPFSEPARHERFRFTRDWLRGQFGRVDDPRDPDFAVALQLDLPAEHLFTQRVWLSMVGVLCQLESEVEVAPVLRRWLPGFATETSS
jgi:predicted unusual protein kinase regulating ubiquinone biosynthesis (AarF/ABC1/UbiB family)